MSEVNYLEMLLLAAPELVVLLTALVVLAMDLLSLRSEAISVRGGLCSAVAVVGCVAAGILCWISAATGDVGDGMFVVTPLILLVKIGLLVIAVPALVLSAHGVFTRHVGEYVALILFAVIGMMFLVSAEDLLMIFVALEMTSLCLYILTAFNKQDIRSVEASLKYFLFGGVSAALALFGFSLLYGLTGSTNLHGVAAGLPGHMGDPLLIVALVSVAAGFGFKIAAVPFHLWAPDAYEGAPTPSAALIATGSKLASFFILAKVMIHGFGGSAGSAAWGQLHSGWTLVLGLMAAVSMIYGNIGALVQVSVKRLLAYSAIAHAGYLLLAVIANSGQGVAALLYYVFVYALATMGAFAVIAAVEDKVGGDRMDNLAGLSSRAPVLSVCLLVFMLSLAGIPPLAGFFGKFYVFVAAANAAQGDLGLLWLVILAIGASVVSLYYYLMVLKQVYVRSASGEAAALKVSPWVVGCSVVLCLAVLLLGCFPAAVLQLFDAAAR